MKLKPIQEQVVVVVGASSGIGREVALRLAKRGASVVVAARSEPGLRSLVDEIVARGGEGVYAVCDVADFAEVGIRSVWWTDFRYAATPSLILPSS